MSFPELDFGILFGEPDFHDDSVLGFVVDREHDKTSSGETHPYLDPFDFASEEPFIFGEPLKPATNFAWDLPEAHFRKEVQRKRASGNKLSSNETPIPLPESPLEQQMLVHTLRVNVTASESNPNSKARLGPKDLKEIGKETKMQPGQGVAPEFMKRSSLGAFGPVVTKIRKKRKSDAGTAWAERGEADGVSTSHGRDNANSQEGKGLSTSLIEDQDEATRLGFLPMDIVLE
ncbi:hypothetical protein M413DRAFT_447285 [Hebeloma cylindrosporum]|uniref:Uncharacterized protein n=1 Tax=Hebeloma cylindrosporum TaxID=76867 RepID=A0A0C3C6W4_HEBCY|nr:hypothetical protein M413DRAFT_447285 [Hebeloma cylindrosporum h7]